MNNSDFYKVYILCGYRLKNKFQLLFFCMYLFIFVPIVQKRVKFKHTKLQNASFFNLQVLQLPEVLCIHLKRFRHELMFSSKISSAVSFPLKGLDMRPYLHKDCVSQVTNYELFSVICHHGTAGGGHYTCYALNNGQWYEFDDQFVTEVSAETVQACQAYVLFYRKVVSEIHAIYYC